MGGDLPRPTARCRFCRRNERCTLENEGTWRRVPDRLQGAPIVGGLRRVERATVSIPIRHVRPPERRKSGVPAHPQSPNRKGRLPCFGIVDSGADFCAFPMSFAHTLGLNPLNQTPSATFGAGSGGPAQTYHFDAVLEFPTLGAFPLRAGFMDSLNTLGFGLLGHSGFMDRLIVSFSALHDEGRRRLGRPEDDRALFAKFLSF